MLRLRQREPDRQERDLVIAQALGAAIEAKPRCHNFNDNTVAYTKATETKAAEVNAARNMSRNSFSWS